MNYKNLVTETWDGFLVKFSIDSITLKNLILSEDNFFVLKEVGLPLIGFSEANSFRLTFLPFTFINQLNISGNDYYIIGDLSINYTGVSLAAIEVNTQVVFYLSRNKNCSFDLLYLNSSLDKFLYFFTKFNLFYKRFSGQIIEEDIKIEFEKLNEELKKEDIIAMSNPNSFWADMISYILVDFGDFLL